MSLPAVAEPYTVRPAPPDGSPEWLEMRRAGIGGSDAAAVVGLSRYSTPYDVYMDKLGIARAKEATRAMRLGSAMEPIIVQEYAEEVGCKVSKPAHMFFSLECPWMLANLDGVRHDDGRLVEAKRSDNPDAWGPSGSDSYPEDYFIQVQHGMFVTGKALADLVVLLPYNDLRIYTIMADRGIQEGLAEEEGRFWRECVEARVPPPIDFGADGALETVKKVYPRVERETVTLVDAAAFLAEKYVQAGAALKEAEREKERLQTQLLAFMGNASHAVIPGRYELKRTEIRKKPYTVTPKPYITMNIKEIKDNG